MDAVKLQSESVMAARFSTEEVLDLVTADDDFGVSDSESSVKASMLTVDNAGLVAWKSKAFKK